MAGDQLNSWPEEEIFCLPARAMADSDDAATARGRQRELR